MPGPNPFYDPERPVEKTSGGHLPHWYQEGKIIYVTFRLADSLPQSEIKRINEVVARFKLLHPLPWDPATASAYRKLVGPKMEELLDNGYGDCVLRYPDVREIIVSALNHKASASYEIVAYVIMPNHVHLLLRLYPAAETADIIRTLKSYTANAINRHLGRKGTLWQKEYFDHIVRNPVSLRKFIIYIADNPIHLLPNTYTLYINPSYKP